jgi:hypothetical protein
LIWFILFYFFRDQWGWLYSSRLFGRESYFQYHRGENGHNDVTMDKAEEDARRLLASDHHFTLI